MNKLNNIDLSKSKQNDLYGKVFCFTGFRNIGIEKQIIDRGGKINNNISKNVHYLIVPNKINKSSKISEAEKKNICIIKLDDLLIKFNL
jgi:NAD-dependent DNA ligase